MPVIGEGTSLVAFVPGALEALVSNIRTKFARVGHTHGTSGIEDGAVTADKLSSDVLAAMGGVSEADLYDVLFEDDDGATGTLTLANAVTGYGATAYKRLVIYHWACPGSAGSRCHGSTTLEMTSPMQYSERNVALSSAVCSGSTFYQFFPLARLSGSKMYVYNEYQGAVNGSSGKVNGATASTSSGEFKVHVTRIEGWKV